jgi:predicted unusual protein kinase regulating ubiquinone biosynthesis (AarF/ABC1/UbiB family)
VTEPNKDKSARPASRVPEGRTERVFRLGSMLAGIAGDAAYEALRRAARRSGETGSVVLSPATARRLTETLADLRGAAMKLGQMLSLQGEDLLPPEFAEVLATLRSQAHFMPELQVRQVLERELGPEWESLFREFDFEAIAAASIGQVHGAVAADGRDLALKIQYPGVARSISSDVDNLGVVLRLARVLPVDLEIRPILEEIKRELHREADYRREADNTERYAGLVADDPSVLVPRVHRDLSTRHLLATDRVYARPIEDLRSPEHTQERRDRVGERLISLVVRELFSFRFMQTDPNFANYLFDPQQERVALLDFGSVRRFTKGFTETYRRFIVASVEEDPATLFDAARELGFLRGDESRAELEMFSRLCALATEPLRVRSRYDFPESDLAARAREAGLEALYHHRLPQPPPETIFLHRKLGGSFLLLGHIGARVDCHTLYEEFVRDQRAG